MNKVILIGRIVADPEVRYTQGESASAVAKYRLAVERRFRREGEPTADFISCVAFGKNGEFAERYLRKGVKIAVEGRIQTGSYTNKDGQKVYTTDIVVEAHEFCESRPSQSNSEVPPIAPVSSYTTTEVGEGFMNIPDGIDDELPFD